MSTKPDNRIAERTRERAEERRRQQRRRQLQVTAVVVGTILLVVIALVIIANAPSDAPIPVGASTRYEGLTTSTSENGYPLLGQRDARVQVEMLAAFTEPQAYAFYTDVYPALLERVRAGEINFSFAPLKIGTGRNPEGAARTALCAAEQNQFWPTFDTLYTWQHDYEDSAFNTNRLRAGVDALGIRTDAFNDCFGQGRINDLMVKAQQGITGPITVKVNGAVVAADLESINAQIDTFGPFTPASEATSEATAEATDEAMLEATAEATDEAMLETTAEATDEAMLETTAEATSEAASTATARPIMLPTSRAPQATTEATAEATVGN